MKKILFLIIFGLFIGLPVIAHAGILPPCTATGNCGFCDMMFTVNAIMRWIVLLAGSLALLFFVWGGFLFVTSAGVETRAKKGKNVLTNTLYGVIVVFLSWTGVSFMINSIAGTSQVMLFTDDQHVAWYNLCIGTGSLEDCTGKGDGYPCGPKMTKHCEDNDCKEGRACDWLKEQAIDKRTNKGPYSDYECQKVGPNNTCGVRSVAECDIAPNCIKNLCGLDTENMPKVCCIPLTNSAE